MQESLSVPLPLLNNAYQGGGTCTAVFYSPDLETFLYQHFGRHHLCLKVFKHPMEDLSIHVWHPTRGLLLISCTKAQNLFALRGLAPRVYDIVPLNDTSWAQITDYVGDIDPPTSTAKSPDVRKEFRISTDWDMNKENWVNGWLVDFDAFHWRDPDQYERDMQGRINKYATWGSNPLPYQSDFGLPSQRDMVHRVEMMKLDEVDFGGKTVLDLGCSLGLFCQDALRRGAKRAIGVEIKEELADLCYEVANWRGCWNVDFFSMVLPRDRKQLVKEAELASFDIVYALSVDRQIGYASWMVEMCDDVFYLEGHVPDKEHTYREGLEADFSEVEFLGMTRDHGPRPLFRCRK